MEPDDLRAIARDAMRQRGLQPDLPAAAQREVAALPGPCRAASAVEDLRALPWCSIDNDDSRDLDQLTVMLPTDDGSTRIAVAIADVACLVRAGSAVDDHARRNTTSVYTAACVFPMLPERLSTDLTSLNPGEDRLAVVIELHLQADGSVAPPPASTVYPALVHNHAKLAYDAVAAWLDGDRSAVPPAIAAVPGLAAQLEKQDAAAQALKQRRHAQGALSLATTGTRPVFADGVLTDLRPDLGNRAKELISNLMIAANGVTARWLEARGVPTLRRMLKVPARWDRIRALAAEAGDSLPETPEAAALDAFLTRRRAAEPTKFADLSLAVVKLLGSGEYVVAVSGRPVDGHFGLAVNDYTHSTAPNRRYPDLLTQRLLQAAFENAPPPLSVPEMEALAAHCTTQEDNAAKVERQVRKSAVALLLADRIGETFHGIVTGASAKGTWVKVNQPTVEGRVVRGQEGLDVGERVQVTLVRVDPRRGYIDFEKRKSGRS